MDYTLILPNGKLMRFYVRAAAELYQKVNGGTIVSNAIFQEALDANRAELAKIMLR